MKVLTINIRTTLVVQHDMMHQSLGLPVSSYN